MKISVAGCSERTLNPARRYGAIWQWYRTRVHVIEGAFHGTTGSCLIAECYRDALPMLLEAEVQLVQGPRPRCEPWGRRAGVLGGGVGCQARQERSAAQRWKEQSTLWDGAWEGCVG